MKPRIIYISVTLLLFPVAAHGGGNDTPYGFVRGSVEGFAGAGFSYSSGQGGIHPNYGGGGISVGLNPYFGVFVQGGYSRVANEDAFSCTGAPCLSTTVRVNMGYAASGAEVVATNHSRFVPYAKIGIGYGRATGSAAVYGFNVSASSGSTAVVFGGGIRTYLYHHFGLFGDIQGLHFVGGNSGGTTVISTIGIFVQSK